MGDAVSGTEELRWLLQVHPARAYLAIMDGKNSELEERRCCWISQADVVFSELGLA